jgi:lipopolysaccharide transport system ATP-binding protein
MSSPAIRVRGLGKRYRLGQRRQISGLLGEQIAHVVKRPFVQLGSRLRHANGDDGQRAQVFWALRDVSFEVQAGEALGIIGRNGAGKSTLLKILSRITKPTTGRVELYGRVGSLLEVGTGFHQELTGRENIFLNGAILGMHRAEIARKFDEIVAFAEVPDYIDTQVKHYSTGMYMRLAFAVAAHLEPEILVVDEVLAVGDAAFQKKCLGKMSDVAKEGRTVLFVSHDLTAIQALCTRALRLSGGQLVGAGPVAEQVGEYLAQNRGNAQNELDHPVELTPRTQLVRLGFSSNPVKSGRPTELYVELQSARAMRIDEFAVLIFDSLNRRVGLIDLRRAGEQLKTNGQDNLKLRVALDALPLVEGEYRVGIWIRSDDVSRAKHDLVMLNVVTDVAQGDFVPYHAMARGVVALEYTVEREN